MILVMGVTGSGKSYFINKLAQGAVAEGHKLRSSEFVTQSSVIIAYIEQKQLSVK